MTDLVTQGQLEMLATVLSVETERIRHYERLGAETIHELRSEISATLFDSLASTFARVAKLAPLIPDALVAKLAEKIVPPMVSGLAAGALGVAYPGRIHSVMGRMSPTYLAAAAPYLDPRVIATLAPSMDPAVLVPAAEELLVRRQYATAANFVEHANAELIAAFETGIADNEGLLRTAALTPNAKRLNEILRLFPADRLCSIIIETADGSDDLVLTGLSVLGRLDPDLVQRYADVLIDSLDDEGIARLLRVVRDGGADADLRQIVELSSVDVSERIAAVEASYIRV
ncbi:hypothetical protein [Antrihabitans stalactiti]|uniref:DUF2336 domain-containing protein n=1 Tax=Antrihabitans stalactiti TaxID=2584121 RepID=A0A848KAM0_9NOCA|nr:hypothetical protein [Antrihabitans stalactiti]NMN94726.1 hypothetical protein [Antrihabitans stalactiti]